MPSPNPFLIFLLIIILLMPKAKVLDKVYECLRCSYEWVGRKAAPPKSCPRCHSYTWNKEKK